MNEARLKILDKMLHKGWCSYLDIAKALYHAMGGFTSEEYGITKDIEEKPRFQSFNKYLIDCYHNHIGHDLFDIADIWILAHENRLLSKGNKDDQVYRSIIRDKLIVDEKRPQYKTPVTDPDAKTEKGEVDLKRVKFYRYRDPNYSLFDSGDFKIFDDKIKKKRAKSSFAKATKKNISDDAVNSVRFEPDTPLDEEVSLQIKQSIILQEELEEFEQQSKDIINRLSSKLERSAKEKDERWISQSIKLYKNILELAKNPLSNVDKRQIAAHVHDLAFFLATENQYHLLGERFEEAIDIYQKLLLEQKHILEDYAVDAEGFDKDAVNPRALKKQMLHDEEMVAEALLSLARVRFDKHDTDNAKSMLDKALNLSADGSQCMARILHLRGIIHSVEGDNNSANTDIEQAYNFAVSSDLDINERLSIMMSLAELKQAESNTVEAERLYDDIITQCRNIETPSDEILATALMSASLIHLSNGDIAKADKEIADAIHLFEALYVNEPDKILPNVLSAKYIKTLILGQQGLFNDAIDTGEWIIKQYEQSNETLKALCTQEAYQTLLYLKELYQATGNESEIQRLDEMLGVINL